MNAELRRLRNAALLAVLRDLEVNGLAIQRLIDLRADQLRIHGGTMRIQLAHLDIHLNASSFDPVMTYLTEMRLLGKDLPLFCARQRYQPLTLAGLKSILRRQRRREKQRVASGAVP